MAAYRRSGRAAPVAAQGPFQDRHLIFELPDALLGRAQFCPLSAAQARLLTGVDQLLLAPHVDRLVADPQIGSDLGDGTASSY